MAGYPIECIVCSEDVLSKEDYLRHYLRHQSDVTLLVQDLLGRGYSEACEPDRPDAAINGESPYITADLINQGQEDGHQPPIKRQIRRAKRPRQFKCTEEEDCTREFKTSQKLVRHRFTHYLWNQACDDCKDTFTNASAFIIHVCNGTKPKQKQMDGRQKHVEDVLRLNFTRNPGQRGKRIKAGALAASAQPPIDASQTMQGMALLAAGSASSTQALIGTFQTMQGMPLLAAGSSETGVLPNVNENTQNHMSLWEQLAPWQENGMDSTMEWPAR